jgi:tetratricopeptide (TPR) repeat protein
MNVKLPALEARPHRGRAGIALVICLLAVATLARCASSRAGSEEVPFSDLANEQQVGQIAAHLQVHPDDLGARYRLVSIYLDELMFAKATRELNEIIRRVPDDVKGYELLALVQARGPDNDVAAAVATLKAAIGRVPRCASLHANLALRYLDRGETSLAEDEAKAAAGLATKAGDRAVAYLILAGISRLSGRQDDADHYYLLAKQDGAGEAATQGAVHFPMMAGELASFGSMLASHPRSLERARRLDAMLRKAARPDEKHENHWP